MDLSDPGDAAFLQCQEHDGLFGLLLFDEGDGYSEMSLVYSKYSLPFQLNEEVFNASFSAVVTKQSNEPAYDFCEMNGYKCE